MRRFALLLVVGIAALFLVAAGDSPRRLRFPAHGFSISPLESAGHEHSIILMMYLPPSGDFAPNVNVLSQKSVGTIDDYVTVSKQEFEKAGLKMIKFNRLDDHTITMEYSGKMNDKALHWYAKASLKGDEILLVTATAADDQWSNDSAQLQSCVDSFQRDSE